MECGGCPLWAKLSKSLHCSQVPDLTLDRVESQLEHFPVRRLARRQHLGLGLGQCQFKPVLTSLRIAFLRRERWSEGLHTLRLFLLCFDRFAFKPARHARDHSRNRAVPFTDEESGCAVTRFEGNSLHRWLLP